MPRPATQSRHEGNSILRSWARDVTGDVLSIGSGSDSDREGGSYRSYFKAADSYTTSDVAPGSDLNLDVRDMTEVETGSYEGVFCHSVLEHVDDPFMSIREIARVLAPGGILLLGVPFRYPIHRAPGDFWRFTEFGVRRLVEGVGEMVIMDLVGVDGPEKHPALYWVRAVKP